MRAKAQMKTWHGGHAGKTWARHGDVGGSGLGGVGGRLVGDGFCAGGDEAKRTRRGNVGSKGGVAVSDGVVGLHGEWLAVSCGVRVWVRCGRRHHFGVR